MLRYLIEFKIIIITRQDTLKKEFILVFSKYLENAETTFGTYENFYNFSKDFFLRILLVISVI